MDPARLQLHDEEDRVADQPTQRQHLDRTRKRPRLRPTDRLFWVLLSRFWSGWLQEPAHGSARACSGQPPSPLPDTDVVVGDAALQSGAPFGLGTVVVCCGNAAVGFEGAETLLLAELGAAAIGCRGNGAGPIDGAATRMGLAPMGLGAIGVRARHATAAAGDTIAITLNAP